MNKQQNSEVSAFLPMFQKGIWVFGIISWIFGLTDRSIALLADGYLSAIDIVQLFTRNLGLKPRPSRTALYLLGLCIISLRLYSQIFRYSTKSRVE